MAQQQTSLPTTHGAVRTIINSNASDAETRLAKADKARIGFADFNDHATAVTPLSITSAGGWTLLTNDKAGSFTNTSFLPEGISSSVFASNQFNFSALHVGDMVNIRKEIVVTTSSPNQNISTRLRVGIGSPSEFSIVFSEQVFKTAGAHTINAFNGFYIGSNDIKSYPARFEILTDANASVVVSGWFMQFLLRGEAS